METPISRPLVLVVDDDKVVHLVLKQVLRDFAGSALFCEDGATALALANEVLPDLVITDALLPGLDGRELARILKTTPETRHCKVAIITGLYKGLRYRSEALRQFHVDEYLEKPLNMERIRALIASVGSSVGPASETRFASVNR